MMKQPTRWLFHHRIYVSRDIISGYWSVATIANSITSIKESTKPLLPKMSLCVPPSNHHSSVLCSSPHSVAATAAASSDYPMDGARQSATLCWAIYRHKSYNPANLPIK